MTWNQCLRSSHAGLVTQGRWKEASAATFNQVEAERMLCNYYLSFTEGSSSSVVLHTCFVKNAMLNKLILFVIKLWILWAFILSPTFKRKPIRRPISLMPWQKEIQEEIENILQYASKYKTGWCKHYRCCLRSISIIKSFQESIGPGKHQCRQSFWIFACLSFPA